MKPVPPQVLLSFAKELANAKPGFIRTVFQIKSRLKNELLNNFFSGIPLPSHYYVTNYFLDAGNIWVVQVLVQFCHSHSTGFKENETTGKRFPGPESNRVLPNA
jgi:hypothetical protein